MLNRVSKLLTSSYKKLHVIKPVFIQQYKAMSTSQLNFHEPLYKLDIKAMDHLIKVIIDEWHALALKMPELYRSTFQDFFSKLQFAENTTLEEKVSKIEEINVKAFVKISEMDDVTFSNMLNNGILNWEHLLSLPLVRLSTKKQFKLMQKSIRLDSPEILTKLIYEHNIDPDIEIQPGNTLLLNLSGYDNSKLPFIEVLLKAKADPLHESPFGTPIENAARNAGLWWGDGEPTAVFKLILKYTELKEGTKVYNNVVENLKASTTQEVFDSLTLLENGEQQKITAFEEIDLHLKTMGEQLDSFSTKQAERS